MERRKQRMACRLFSKHPETMVDTCVQKVRELEIRARSCYADEIEMGSEEFVKMLILDGCFIIGLLLRCRSIAIRLRSLRSGRDHYQPTL
ncbi:hypothetical protein QJS10_CPB17g01125 [Acorus calamus]|uniref:Uncharacterized protein n=1 Tax=Acorus calamus TaxID=4465 RepID=A0AAV9CXE3_ACOCL|nr:hypothetical protein QJS10_CPB17g01125 [Acorus calamus]